MLPSRPNGQQAVGRIMSAPIGHYRPSTCGIGPRRSLMPLRMATTSLNRGYDGRLVCERTMRGYDQRSAELSDDSEMPRS